MATILDPRLSLATALDSQPGVYALLLGSGASTGAGIPTGWGVVESLVRKAAVAGGESPGATFDADKWWAVNGEGELGYSSVLAALASTRSARRALLARFFEPTDDDRTDGKKVPGSAHKAIAALVRKGIIRVIVTTNFDRLMESALQAEGVTVQVIDSAAKATGMEPLQHMACTVIKLHGDYASLDQRNTVDELASYPTPIKRLLTRVLDEYGLIVSGWSGDWDAALVSAIEANANRRYPLYWVARSAPGGVAQRLTARSGSHIIEGLTADEFFPDLLSRIDALETMGESPDSVNLALGRLKRVLPDPVRHIEVRDLFDAELVKLSEFLEEAVKWTQPPDWDGAEAGLADLRTHTATLLKLYTNGILLDRDRQHTDLWVEVLRRSMAARRPDWANSWWLKYLHVPALLLMRAGTMAALLARHEDVARKIMQEPTWHSIFVDSNTAQPAWSVLQPWNVFADTLNNLPRFALTGSKYHWPESRLVREDLQEFVEPLAAGEDYTTLHDRAEFRAALAYQFAEHQYRQPIHGEFIGDQKWTWRAGDGEKEKPILGIDFAENGDTKAWGLDEENSDWFNTQIEELYEQLRKGRRFG
ncbi:SIR2 family protein [Rathayibacter soli]|uniref:SIR2 family protein n=1 Tax=Rathayibacter soli TaxID=3144168 RepID=UPI0027E53665|nr:SIR2 family protein [Glaciibacter superstes]